MLTVIRVLDKFEKSQSYLSINTSVSKYRRTSPLRCALRNNLLILFLSVTENCPAKAGSAYTILENMRQSNITESACRERLIVGYICAKKY